ncbi:MAG TPA: helix-turn-helix transcriptional regulator [Thermoanaerobaculia bacterium]|nr:helix-turn-helix transcriptional regulator [Thermoanaerobaculia bacterium]
MPKTRPRPDAIIFGDMFRQFRLQRGWTLRVCAHHLGITASYLGVLESGRNMPSIHLLLLFADVFDVHAWEILRSFEETRMAQFVAAAAAEATQE